jgi:outer membrane biosynthesis protein TonB
MAEKNASKRPPRPQRPRGGGFKLKSFPKEFEKSFFDGFDPLYWMILGISTLIFFPMLMALASNSDSIFALSQEELEERKELIIKKIYNVEIEEEEEETPEETKEEEVPDEEFEAQAQEERKKQLAARKSGPKNAAPGRSVADIRAARAARRAARDARRAQEMQAVESSGSIALLTGGVGAAGETVRDLLGEASSSNIDVEGALSSATGLAVGAGGKGDPSLGLSGRGTQGGRESTGSVEGLVGGLGGAGTQSLGSRRGGISFGNVVVKGGRGDKSRKSSEISNVIKKSMPAIEQCFKRAQRLNPSLRGVISVRFKITKRGTIRDIKIIQDTVGSSKVSRCLKNVIKRLRGFGRAKSDVVIPNQKFTFD